MWSLYVSLAFLVATLFTLYPSHFDLKKNLMVHLTEKEIKHYEHIVEQRRNIYIQGLCLGLLISLGAIFLFPINNTQSKYNMLFVAIAITFIVNYFYYILYPKDSYMIEILDTKEENKAWLEIYKHMQFCYHIGFLFGLAGAGFLHYYAIF